MRFSSIRVGARVKVFGAISPAEGGTVFYLEDRLGTVISRDGNWLEIDLDDALPEPRLKNPQRIDCIHVKQCQLHGKRSK